MVILAAIDEKERSKRVVEVAYDLARTYDDTLVALHVAPDEEYEAHRDSIQNIPGFGDFSFSQEAGSARRFAKEFTTETIGDVDDVVLEPRGRVGDIAEEILAEATEREPRFLVLSGRRRSPVGKAVFGSTTQKVLLQAECPVVSVLSDT